MELDASTAPEVVPEIIVLLSELGLCPIATDCGGAGLPDLGGGVVGPEGFAGAGTERATRSLSSPDVIEIFRLVAIAVPSAFIA